jgi:hypothetical protein
MMKSMTIAFGLACVLVCASGCSSIADLSGYGDAELGAHGPHFYGGVQLDAAVMKRPVDAGPKDPKPGPYEPLRWIFCFFDFPFALVADTGLAPLTGLSELIVNHDREKSKSTPKPAGTAAAR